MTDDFESEPLCRNQTCEAATLVLDLDGYEGPLDLLLTLAKTQKVDLAKLSMVELVDQYLVFLDTHGYADLAVSGDYLVMAAWLTYLKSRLILPPPAPGQADSEQEVAEALADQFRRLHAMETAAAAWLARPQRGRDHFTRSRPQAHRRHQRPSWVNGYHDGLLTCVPDTVAPARTAPLRLAPLDYYPVDQAIRRLTAVLETSPEWVRLQQCVPDDLQGLPARSATAAHFVASLELCRRQQLDLRQEPNIEVDRPAFGPVWLRRRPTAS